MNAKCKMVKFIWINVAQMYVSIIVWPIKYNATAMSFHAIFFSLFQSIVSLWIENFSIANYNAVFTMLNSDVGCNVCMLWMKAKMSCKMRHTSACMCTFACDRAQARACISSEKRWIHETLIKQQMVYLSLLFSNHIISFKIRCVCIFTRTSEIHALTFSFYLHTHSDTGTI